MFKNVIIYSLTKQFQFLAYSQMKESRDALEAQVAKERELRRVTEGVLVGHKDVWSSLIRLSDKCGSTQAQLGQGLDQVR